MFTYEHKTVDKPYICCDMLQGVLFYRVLLRYIAIKRVLILLDNTIYLENLAPTTVYTYMYICSNINLWSQYILECQASEKSRQN